MVYDDCHHQFALYYSNERLIEDFYRLKLYYSFVSYLSSCLSFQNVIYSVTTQVIISFLLQVLRVYFHENFDELNGYEFMLLVAMRLASILFITKYFIPRHYHYQILFIVELGIMILLKFREAQKKDDDRVPKNVVFMCIQCFVFISITILIICALILIPVWTVICNVFL